MTRMDIDINIFGRDYPLEWAEEGAALVECLEGLKRQIAAPAVVDHSSMMYPLVFSAYEKAGAERGYSGDVVLWLLRRYSAKNLREFIEAHAEIDEEWTAWRNEGLKYKVYQKITLHDDVQKAVVSEASRLQALITTAMEKAEAEKEARKKAEAEEKARLLDGVIWITTQREIWDEGGKTTEYEHEITIKDKTYTVRECNIFDWGRVVVVIDGDDDEDSERAAEIVGRYGPLAGCGVRM